MKSGLKLPLTSDGDRISQADGTAVAFVRGEPAEATLIAADMTLCCNSHNIMLEVLKAIVEADERAIAELHRMGAVPPAEATKLTEAAKIAIDYAGTNPSAVFAGMQKRLGALKDLVRDVEDFLLDHKNGLGPDVSRLQKSLDQVPA